jgi:2-methylisocitrate lyase-like PEP mutase family enzyme
MSPELIAKARAFREANSRGQLLLPNAWDAVSARIFEDAGFPSMGTTSAGIAFTRGVRDGQRVTRETMMHEVHTIASAVRVPVTADIESGYGSEPEAVSSTVRAALQAGAVGINLEDNTHTSGGAPLFELRPQSDRIRAARREADAHGVPLTINARTDTFLMQVGSNDAERMRMSVERGLAYLSAGADLVFVPGLLDLAALRTLSAAFEGRISVMAGPGAPNASELFEAGVRRVSVGPAAMLATLGCLRALAQDMRSNGGWSKIEASFLGFSAVQALFRA